MRGVVTGLNECFIIGQNTRDRILQRNPQSAPLIHPLLAGKDIRKYRVEFQERHLIAIPKGWTTTQIRLPTPPPNFSEDEAWAWFQDAHPALAEHLAQFEEAARKRRNQGDFWWELSPRREFFAKLEQPKIIYPIIASGSRFTYDTLGYYLNDKAFFIPLEDYYLIGVLNSNLLWFYGKKNLPTLGDAEKGGGLEWRGTYVKRLPIVPAAVEDPRRQAIEAAVGEALTLAPRRAAALPGSQEGLDLDRRLAQLADEIDEAVFALYGLTTEQRARVRGE